MEAIDVMDAKQPSRAVVGVGHGELAPFWGLTLRELLALQDFAPKEDETAKRDTTGG